MKKKKNYKENPINDNSVNEPLLNLNKGNKQIITFNSFEEQAAFELKQLTKLSGIDILIQLRKFINIAYAMHGYNPDKLPKKHSIKIISGEYL